MNHIDGSSAPRGLTRSSNPEAGRHIRFWSVCLVSVILFHAPLLALAALALNDSRYTFIATIPFITCGLVWLHRSEIFSRTQYSSGVGVGVVLLGLSLAAITNWEGSQKKDALALNVLALVFLIAGPFAWCYGIRAVREALFPLAMLILMVPLPASAMDQIVAFLQHASAAMSYGLFKLLGAPVLREGTVKFLLPGVTIEVAEECSGIRSSSSLFISGLVAGYLLLRPGWSRIIFSAMTIPVVIFKNAVRIVTISLLGVYVDPGFLHGRLHRYGGLPFSLLALALLAPLLVALMKAERSGDDPSHGPGTDKLPLDQRQKLT